MWRSAVQLCAGLLETARFNDAATVMEALRFSGVWQGRAQSTAFGGLAQLARAPALQAGGQRFESVILHLSHTLGYQLSFPNCHNMANGTVIFDVLTQKQIDKTDASVLITDAKVK